MSHSKQDKEIIKEISKYRAIALIHRYLYYVKSEPIISDIAYDMFERKLKALVTQYSGLAFEADNSTFCPTKNVGSDNPEDYPRRIEQLAEDLLKTYKGEHEKCDVLDVPILSSPSVSQQEPDTHRTDKI